MTEKRFYIEDEHIKDNLEAHNPFYVDTYNEAKRFCELLNDLNQEVIDAEHYHSVVLENFKAISKDYDKLKEENEQLKKENRSLIIELDAHKHIQHTKYEQIKKENEQLESDLQMSREKALYWRNKAENLFGDMRTNVELMRENRQLKNELKELKKAVK